MVKIALISGQFGRGEAKEYLAHRDGVDAYLISLINEISINFEIITDRAIIKKKAKDISLEIHLNVQIPITTAPRVCFLLEDHEIRPQNYFYNFIRYEHLFTFNKTFSELSTNIHWTRYPHDIKFEKFTLADSRNIDFVMFASNRNTLFSSKRSLYSYRQKVINYFNNYHPDRLQLYGKGWGNSMVKPGVTSRLIHELGKSFPYFGANLNRIKVWKGIAESKYEILRFSRFNICAENLLGIRGYVSEKIIDSFQTGTIPIYIPSSSENQDLIPFDLYINPLDFHSLDNLYDFCMSITNEEYLAWQNKMKSFILNNKAQFSINNYIREVCNILNIYL